jgi:hypothetical protein
MKRFTLKIVLFVIPIFFIIVIMELSLRSIPDDHKQQKKYLDANSNKIETLILGSSQTFCGIDPKYFTSKTYNVAYLAQTLDLDFLIVNKYKDNFRSLKTIVLPISYFSLFSNLRFTIVSWRLKKYEIYSDLSLYEKLFKNYELSNQNLKVSVQRLNDYYLNKNNPLYSDSLGWGMTFKSEYAKDLIETGKTTALLHRFDLELEVVQIATKENEILLKEFMEWSENKNIKVILLTPPVYKTYRDNLDVEQLNLTIETANAIASKYNNCEYYNLIDDSIFTASDYYDANHLSEIGAEKLSKIISSIIEDVAN